MIRKYLLLVPVIIAGFFFTSADSPLEISGAGATYPNPLYTKMFSEYYLKTGTRVNYTSIGSKAGIRLLFEKTVDFGASDAYLPDSDIRKTNDIIHIPTCINAVVISYNLPGISKLKLSTQTLGGIFAGNIMRWNDPRIVNENTEIKLPDLEIKIIHRSDGSMLTSIFTQYLVGVSREFAFKVPKNALEIRWPVGFGGKGNEGIAGQLKDNPGAIGYLDFAYAVQNNMPVADIGNSGGRFITPTIQTIYNSGDVNMPFDNRIFLANSKNPGAYPITSFTWLMLYKEQDYNNKTLAQAKLLTTLLWWMIHDGQQYNEPLMYATLSPNAITSSEALLKKVTYKGKPVLVDK